MVVKSQIKLIRSLHQKKYRNQHGLFFVEGRKVVQELLASEFVPHSIYSNFSDLFNLSEDILTPVSDFDLKQMSYLKNPNGVLGVFHIPDVKPIAYNNWIVVLDDIRDPGNLGTIIRLCDWFGIKDLVCSRNTVDCYNPKVLQATMGSISRINISYVDLPDFVKEVEIPVYGTFMNEDSVYQVKFPKKGILVLGNEANGISATMEEMVSRKITIPQYGNQTTESLNVATATGILLNEIRRS